MLSNQDTTGLAGGSTGGPAGRGVEPQAPAAMGETSASGVEQGGTVQGGVNPGEAEADGAKVDGAKADGVEGGGSPLRPGATDVQAYIGRQLRAVYDDVVKQPIPDRFLALMKQLEDGAREP